MTFPRPDAPPPTPPAETPLRTFTYKRSDWSVGTVQATYIQFMAEHVTFWIQQDGDWDFMVLAESNRDCQEIKEQR